MPRTPRKKSSLGLYHITMRGNEQQDIFREKEDYEKFISILERSIKQFEFRLIAWCLMPNHIHLIVREGTHPIGNAIRGISASYVFWFNAKYYRVGHLFQGRYGSVPIENSDYFLSAIRYVHLNPVDGKLCDSPEKYPYSSYCSIFKSGRFPDDYMMYGVIRKDEFERYHQEKNTDLLEIFEEEKKNRISDEEARKIIKKYIGNQDTTVVVSLPREKRTDVIWELLEAGGSLRQINRITGVAISVIRAIKQGK